MVNSVLFLGLASSYTEGMLYQDNYLNEIVSEKVNKVTYVSNPEKFIDGKLVDIGPSDYIVNNKYRLIRVPYIRIISSFITKKIRAFYGIKKILNEVKPDVIYCHGFHYLSVLDIISYKKNNNKTKIYVDSHVDEFNSAKNILSRRILHGIYYKYLINKLLPYIDKYLYVTESVRKFSNEVYKIDNEKMYFFPLGGTIYDNSKYEKERKRIRSMFNIDNDEILMMHSGKMDKNKKTLELIEAFCAVEDKKAKLIIVGRIEDDIINEFNKLIKGNTRIYYVGWKDGNELKNYLCAADLYCQPGTVSATLQNAICCKCPCLSYPDETYIKYFDMGNFFWVKNKKDIEQVFKEIKYRKIDLESMSSKSETFAKKFLDYGKTSSFIYK